MNLPLLRETEKFPFAAAFFASVIVSISGFPSLVCLWSVPDDLRVRTNQDIISPSLKFFTAGCIYNFVVFPLMYLSHLT